MDNVKILQQIYRLVISSERIFVQAHANCGDAVGSTLAMLHWLESINKNCLAFSPEPIPEVFNFLPGVEKIIFDQSKFNLSEFNLLLVLDCGDLERTGIPAKIKQEKRPDVLLINIDHHHTNDYFGDINYVDISAPATATLIHEFFKVNNINLNKKIATCLLNGIFTDTGIFTNLATNQSALEKAADLLVAGASANTILNSISKNRTIKGLKLWGRALERLQLNKEHKIAYTILLQEDFRDFNETTSEAVEGLANFMNNLGDVEITLILREEEGGVIKGSLRTTNNNYDVSKLAKFFGGGGHKKAAGFTIRGQIRYNEERKIWEIF